MSLGDLGGWGEAESASEGAGEATPGGGEFRFGSGLWKIDLDKWRALLHGPTITDAVVQRAQEICDAANAMAMSSMPKEDLQRYGGAELPYMVAVNTDPETDRVRARVKPANAFGREDQARNATLQKAMNMYPNEPKIEVDPSVDKPLEQGRLEEISQAIQSIAGRYTTESSGPGTVSESGAEE